VQNRFDKPLFRDAAFFLILAIAMIICGWDNIIFKPQSELHVWRQSDCISISQYYARGNDFLSPEMHCRISDDGTTGKTVAEFPIIYYIIGKIWSITGTQLWIFRLFNALLSIVALTCLYKTLLSLTKSWFWSVMGPLLLMASPIYAFYGINFLTNVPALNCVIIAWYFFYRYYNYGKTKDLIWVVALFALAGLLKISALTSFMFLLFIFVLDFFRLATFKSKGRIFEKRFLAAGLLLLPLVVSGLWYVGFVEYYCNIHWGRYSFTEPVPAWTLSSEERKHIWDAFTQFTMHQVYPAYIWFFFLGIMLFLFTQFRKVNKFWLIGMPVLLIGLASFCILFFFCLDGHDYYLIDVLIFFVFTYAALAKYITQDFAQEAQSPFVRVIFSLFILYAIMGSGTNVYLRFHGCPPTEKAYRELFANKSTIEFMQIMADKHRSRQIYYDIARELDSRGFSHNTPVIAINDVSFNTLLIILDRPGFTNMADVFSDSTTTAYRIQRGAEVMIVEQPEYETRGIKAFMGHKLFQLDRVGVYDLRPYADSLK